MARIKVINETIKWAEPLKKRAKTDYLVIHHIGPMPSGNYPSDITVQVIDDWHKQRGFSGIGYHYVIYPDGSVHRGRPKDKMGAHCLGHNQESVGINVVGDFNNSDPTQEQVNALCALLADLCELYGLSASEDTIRGHCDLSPSECPGLNLYKLIPEIIEEVQKC